MGILLTAAAASLLALSSNTDTTLSVTTGTRLEIENYGGEIVVQTWNRNAVRIEAQHGSRTEIEFERSGAVLQIDGHTRNGAPTVIDYRLTIPVWMAVELSGIYTDISVEGTRADVRAETVKGEVRVTGGKGAIALQSVEGAVTVANSEGRLELNAVNDDVTVKNVSGSLAVEAVNGDISLVGVQAGEVEITSVNGDIDFEGEIRKDGHYLFSTHNGDIAVSVPENANVTVSVSTYSGEFDSTFPVKLTESRRGKRFTFSLGTGSAELSLESFQGAIQLYRPGEMHSEDSGTTYKEKDEKHKSKNHEEDE